MNAVGEQGRGTHAKTQISPGGEKTSPRRNIPGRGGGADSTPLISSPAVADSTAGADRVRHEGGPG